MFVRQKRRNQDGSVVTYLQLVESKRVEATQGGKSLFLVSATVRSRVVRS